MLLREADTPQAVFEGVMVQKMVYRGAVKSGSKSCAKPIHLELVQKTGKIRMLVLLLFRFFCFSFLSTLCFLREQIANINGWENVSAHRGGRSQRRNKSPQRIDCNGHR